MDLRLTGQVAGLIGLPVAWAAGTLITTYGDGAVDYGDAEADTVAMLAAVHQHAGLWRAGTLLAVLVSVLMLGAVLGLSRLTRSSRVLGALAAGLTLLGTLGMAMHAVFNNLVYGVLAAPDADPHQMVGALDRLEDDPAFAVMLVMAMLGVTLGFVLLAAALVRTRAVPRWAALCVLAFPVSQVVGGLAVVLAGAVLLEVGLVVAAVALVRGPRTPEEAPLTPAPVTRASLTPQA